jgi:hypothetical protein
MVTTIDDRLLTQLWTYREKGAHEPAGLTHDASALSSHDPLRVEKRHGT